MASRGLYIFLPSFLATNHFHVAVSCLQAMLTAVLWPSPVPLGHGWIRDPLIMCCFIIYDWKQLSRTSTGMIARQSTQDNLCYEMAENGMLVVAVNSTGQTCMSHRLCAKLCSEKTAQTQKSTSTVFSRFPPWNIHRAMNTCTTDADISLCHILRSSNDCCRGFGKSTEQMVDVVLAGQDQHTICHELQMIIGCLDMPR